MTTDTTRFSPASPPKPGKSDPLAAARAARKPRDPSLPPMTDRQKLMLSQVMSAKKACVLMAEKLRSGKDITPTAAGACSTLAIEYMNLSGS